MYVIISIALALIAGLLIVLVQQRRKERQRDLAFREWLADYEPSGFSPTSSSFHDV